MPATDEDLGWQRLDKFLFYARFAKTRAAAGMLIAQGGVRINRQPADKAHARLRPGDVLTLPLARRVVVIEITALARRREGAAAAATLYREVA